MFKNVQDNFKKYLRKFQNHFKIIWEKFKKILRKIKKNLY